MLYKKDLNIKRLLLIHRVIRTTRAKYKRYFIAKEKPVPRKHF